MISAGTRNHFALDLGLDRDDPATCLDALTDGEELRVDLGVIADRTFVNNASFGAYAEVVRSPAYRDDKRGTTLQMLPDLLNGHQGARLTARAAGTRIEGPQALLISNGPYEMSDIAGPGPARPAGCRHPGRGRRPGGQRPAGDRAPAPRARPGTDRAHRRRGHRRRRHARRSRSASTARRSCCPRRSAAPSSPGRSAWSSRGNVPAFPPPRRPWNGRGCGSSRPSAPSRRPCPSPPSQAGSQARKHSRKVAGCLSLRPPDRRPAVAWPAGQARHDQQHDGDEQGKPQPWAGSENTKITAARQRPRTEALSSAPSVRQPLAFPAPGRFWLRQATGKHRCRARARSKIMEAWEADSMRSFRAVRR